MEVDAAFKNYYQKKQEALQAEFREKRQRLEERDRQERLQMRLKFEESSLKWERLDRKRKEIGGERNISLKGHICVPAQPRKGLPEQPQEQTQPQHSMQSDVSKSEVPQVLDKLARVLDSKQERVDCQNHQGLSASSMIRR